MAANNKEACVNGDQFTLGFDTKALISSIDSSVKEDVIRFLDNVLLKNSEKVEIEKAESFLEWARRLKYLKLVCTDVPDFILPKNCSGELIDVKVFTKRGPDDQIYDAHKSVRDKVARGNCFFRITRGPHQGTRCILYGLKKFTGGLGDDDDRDKGDNFTWQKYFTKSLDCAKRIIATRKANGEAAHLSCVEIDGQYLICAGSKNVHMLIRNRGDIAQYHGDRYRIAAEVCHCLLDDLDRMEAQQKHQLLSFLAATRLTAIFEILSPAHQHVEDLSYLPKPMVQFITWTTCELEPTPDQQLCTVPPHVGIEIARAFGLNTIQYDIIPVSDVDSRMKQIRGGFQYEGEVLYFLDEADNVIGLLKKKTVWYILCRAVREKARNACGNFIKDRSSFSISRITQQTEKRMNDIQKWLGLSDQTVTAWKTLGIAFVRWALTGLEQGTLGMEDVADKFPVIWKRHLEEAGLSDQITADCHEETDPVEEGAVASGFS